MRRLTMPALLLSPPPALARFALVAAVATAVTVGCVEPGSVAVTNATEQEVLVEISYGGCHWPGPLLPGETTGVCTPLQPVDHVHFRRIGETTIAGPAAPAAFPYRTVRRFDVAGTETTVLAVREGAIEQDFDAPSPFAH